MFNNLIESSSHRSEFKRRGSFVLFTVAGYAVFFILAGVVSIYAYDARMADQNLEVVTMMPLVDLPPPERQPTISAHTPASRETSKQNYYTRKIPMVSVDHPEIAPDHISSKPNPFLPLPDFGVVKLGVHDSNPGGLEGAGPGNSGSHTKNGGPLVIDVTPPPAAPEKKTVPPVIHKRVINSEALSLPKPPYPPRAKQLRIQGTVSIQVLIDEAGNVVSAKALSGSTFLIPEAQKAAYKARFSPTLVGDQPVKVSGVITYNFILQR
jgi:periplasmic protein TonB